MTSIYWTSLCAHKMGFPRAQFLHWRHGVGRALLDDALIDAGIDTRYVMRQPGCRPRLADDSAWFSCSYSSEHVVVAVSHCNVAVDVESLSRQYCRRFIHELPRKFFTLREQAWIKRNPEFAIRFFTEKEAWLKYHCLGIDYGLGRVDRWVIAKDGCGVTELTDIPIPQAVCTMYNTIGYTVTVCNRVVSDARIAWGIEQYRQERIW